MRVRREPPPFRRVTLCGTASVSPWLTRVTVSATGLTELEVPAPAASVRLLLPRAEDEGLVIPTWNGNEFLHADGSRPTIRTYTPRHLDRTTGELQIDVVLHDGGAVPAWLGAAQPGDEVAVSGPGRGYEIAPDASAFLLAGDESAIPALSQLLEQLPTDAAVDVHIEVRRPDARHDLPAHPRAVIHWHDLPPGAPTGTTLLEAIAASDVESTSRVWAAGEAAAMQRIRRHLFEERGVPRALAVVRGYWKVGGAGDDDER